jgi:D-aminoacyl-tRNA deacylase
MRAVLQRALSARVTVEGACVGEIGAGLLILLGVSTQDGEAEAALLAAKIAGLRIFEDGAGKLNRSLIDIGGGVLVVSNFTLYGNCRRGRRPDFIKAAPYDRAKQLYEKFIALLREQGVERIETGRFGADMRVELVGDGPVTLILDTDELR